VDHDARHEQAEREDRQRGLMNVETDWMPWATTGEERHETLI
jgi:hypothetical protein